MSKDEKLRNRILHQTPIPVDVTPEELQTFFERNGWSYVKTHGSHYMYRYENGTLVSVPMAGQKRKGILPVYIKQIREIMIDIDSIEKGRKIDDE